MLIVTTGNDHDYARDFSIEYSDLMNAILTLAQDFDFQLVFVQCLSKASLPQPIASSIFRAEIVEAHSIRCIGYNK